MNHRSVVVWVCVASCLVAAATLSPARAAEQTYKVTAAKQGWATFGIVLPPGEVMHTLQVANLPTQTDVKVRWSDGSVRHAIISAKLPASGSYTLTPADAVSSAPLSLVPDAQVTLTINGVAYVARPTGAPQSLWLSGGIVTEGRWWVPFGNHPARRLRLDMRRFTDGAVKYDFAIENDLNVAQTNLETYDISISVANSVVFQRSGMEHGSFARWRYVYWVSGNDAEPLPDLTPFQRARAIPNYLQTMQRDSSFTVTNDAKWDPLKLGDMHYPAWDYGGRPDIGPYPAWTAQFVRFQTTDLRKYVLKIGDLAGSWGLHLTQPDDRIINVTQLPNFWLTRHNAPTDGINGPANNHAGIKREYQFTEPGSWRPETGSAHVPSFAYVPYLVTGDRYYADEMRFWGNAPLITWNPTLDGNPETFLDDEIRGIAWGLRNLVDAATYLPDGDPDKAYFRRLAEANVAALDAEASKPDVTGVGAMFLGHSAPAPNMINQTTQQFLGWSLWHARDQGIPGGHLAFERLVGYTVRVLTHSGFPAKDVTAVQRHWVLRQDGTRFQLSNGTPDYATLWSYQFTSADGHMLDEKVPILGWHGAEIYPALIAAVDVGLPDANLALANHLAYRETAPWGEVLTLKGDIEKRSQWAIDSFSGAVASAQPATPNRLRIIQP